MGSRGSSFQADADRRYNYHAYQLLPLLLINGSYFKVLQASSLMQRLFQFLFLFNSGNNSALFSPCHASQVGEMVHEFGSMKEADLVPEFITYDTLPNNLRKVGRLDIG
ncbi:uncharacterized protein LOC111309266 [Durio zibethinus]|uniref:Uncharacterized protein LOC111309266 n=1 Tax=Durio zibethinus TaxID=66656 RepID=A0A6P6AGM5_DURZI|nr:uncharacterized protein LOC111309266 [Durio zibethinus]